MIIFTDNNEQPSYKMTKNLTEQLHYANILVLASVTNK